MRTHPMRGKKYPLITCPICSRAVPANWYKQHTKSGCQKASQGAELDYVDVAQLKAWGELNNK